MMSMLDSIFKVTEATIIPKGGDIKFGWEVTAVYRIAKYVSQFYYITLFKMYTLLPVRDCMVMGVKSENYFNKFYFL